MFQFSRGRRRHANLCPKETKSLQIWDWSAGAQRHPQVRVKKGLGLNPEPAPVSVLSKEQGSAAPSQLVSLFANAPTHRVQKDLPTGLDCNVSLSFNQYRSHRIESSTEPSRTSWEAVNPCKVKALNTEQQGYGFPYFFGPITL